jgi:hypothetical protein
VNPQDPLANLHPLREPAVIGWWPPAPGWWVLGALVLLALAALSWFLLRRYRANAYRRRALAKLDTLHRQFATDGDSAAFVVNTNALLKSVALRAYSRRRVAGASGAQWLTFLNSSCPGDRAAFDDRFVTAPYRATPPDIDPDQVRRAAAQWIRHHEVAR